MNPETEQTLFPSDPPAAGDQTAPAADSAEVPEAAKLAAELEQFRDLAMRARADLDNFRKRVAREKEDLARYGTSSLLERLLPVIDNFDLGLDAARATEAARPVVAGFEMVRKQLDDFLRDSGVEPVEAAGSPFDPNLHEAMGNEPSPDVPEGTVTRQTRRGYKLRDRLLRPASVFVSSGPPAAQ